ncbi:caspase family protein [Bradyrhizobium genosp. A]|uniref:caspase family protein n=1 Tax=Bradyrhizobium genosp. A TaxID=83626 RepID=UPI003CE6AA56
MKRLSAGVLVVSCLLLLIEPALGGKRVALVIGNSAYQHAASLEAPASDAKLMADTLRGLGFTLVSGSALVDVDKAGLDAAIQDFGNQISGAEAALFFYAGHAIQLRGTNYLIPTNANPRKDADADFQLADVASVMHQMEGAGIRLRLIILDACRNNPFAGRGLHSNEGGLAPMAAPTGTLISYPAQPGRIASDDSSYTKALVQAVQHPGFAIFDVFNEVGLAVEHSTNAAQLPWVSFWAIDGTFSFMPETTSADQTYLGVSRQAAEAWGLAKDTTSKAAITAIVQRYPGTFYADLARERLKELGAPAAERPAQASAPVWPPATSMKTASVAGLPRAVLYEEVPGTNEQKFAGTVIWHTEPGETSDGKSEPVVHADIEIPDRRTKMTLSLRRNADPALHASHTIDLTVSTPTNPIGWQVSSIPGILMKANEQARGIPLAGLAVKVTDDAFLIGLSNVDADRVRNVKILKEQEWLSVPLVYSNQRRAILAIEKGQAGDQAFEAAFSSWEKMQ